MDSIAVIVNNEKKPAAFEDGYSILLFQKNGTGWHIEKEIRYTVGSNLSVAEYRNLINSVIMQLNNCKVLAGSSISGLVYNVFEKTGFEMFETDSISENLLDDILTDLHTGESEEGPIEVLPPLAPVMAGEEGMYFLNLIDLQHHYPDISSKKALQPFLENTAFYSLKVLCNHIPPWFDTFLPERGLAYSVAENNNGSLAVTIYKKVCE